MTVGILAEKAMMARSLAEALGGMSGTYNGTPYVIVAARGHLVAHKDPTEMVAPDKQAQMASWALSNLPWNPADMSWEREPRRKAPDKKQKVGSNAESKAMLKEIGNVLSKCDEIAHFCDLDPTGEGDLISWEIVDYLNLHHKKQSRGYFVDDKPLSLRKAFEERKPMSSMMEHGEYRKAEARSRYDLMSMQFTRVATAVAGMRGVVLRQGRLKSSMIVLVGDQLEAYNNYVKKPFFQNRFRDENGVMYIDPDQPTFPAAGDVPQTFSRSAVVVDSKTLKSSAPPKLYDLADLSAVLGKAGYKAADVLRTYQSMYESRLLSYPRTEDSTITPEQFNEMLPLVDDIARVVGADVSLLTHRTPRPTHVKPEGAHGANRPGTVVPTSLDAIQSTYGATGRAIYEILAKNFLAIFGEDYRFEQQKGHVADYPTFKGMANVPVDMGYKAIFDAEAVDNDGEVSDDEFTQGLGKSAEPFVYEGANKRPPYPTWTWLKSELKRYDVGTGATRTSTYSEVTNTKTRNPILVEKRGRLSFAPAGSMSYYLLANTHIGDIRLTERLYADMREVAAGNKTIDDVIEPMAQWVVDDIETMKKNLPTMKAKADMTGMEKNDYADKEYGEGEWQGKQVKFNRVWRGKRFTDEQVAALLNDEQVTVEGVVGQDGKSTYDATGKLEVQEFTNSQGKTIKFVGFKMQSSSGGASDKEYAEGEWQGKQVKFNRVARGHRFTDEEIAKLLAGEEIEFYDAQKRDGSGTYGSRGKLAVQEFESNGRKVKFLGYQHLAFANKPGIPDSWMKHTFTEDEKKTLEAGGEIEAKFTWKSGKSSNAKVKYDAEAKRIVPLFDSPKKG